MQYMYTPCHVYNQTKIKNKFKMYKIFVFFCVLCFMILCTINCTRVYMYVELLRVVCTANM